MITVAIDGGAATGKGTLAQRLAKAYDFAYLDTGALYRAVAYDVMSSGFEADNEEAAIRAALSLPTDKIGQIQSNPAIRDEKYGTGASKVSQIPAVRQALLEFQRRFAESPCFADGTPAKGAVLDGRDIGTIICPNADLKVFLTASAEIRAQRRYKELQLRKIYAIYEDVLSDVIARDKRDAERKMAAMKPADDAFVLDTSDLTPDEVFAAVASRLEQKLCGK
ncbi:MAG: (d)CMP kinase [Alphaproteobacteria bacterium]|nr:(d)CMP kinase [Alphaproteobacteria bacterium]